MRNTGINQSFRAELENVTWKLAKANKFVILSWRISHLKTEGEFPQGFDRNVY